MDDLKVLCEKVLHGELDVADLLKNYSTRRSQQELYILTSDLDLRISPADVIHYLKEFIEGRKDNYSAIEWASFISMAGAFHTEEKSDEDEDENFFHYDRMWTIIAEISCPEIDGELTKERARGYIAELEKL